jgi:hypothetical protein
MTLIRNPTTQTPTEGTRNVHSFRRPMSIATYRGVKYDTEAHQSNFRSWWNEIHCNATRWFTYRGHQYRAYEECKL